MVHSLWFGTYVTNDLAAQGHTVPVFQNGKAT
jgi:hypothetical protein